MKSVIGGETVLFIGAHFELNDTTDEVTKYYFAGASRIAVRKYIVPQTTSLTYLLGDHLGSTSLAVDAATGEIVETRYKPWGEVRFTTEDLTVPIEEITLPTRYTFTGQYSYISDSATDLTASASFGLMFYNARWYDPALGRMAQADSIMPGGVQGLDRYAYVGNNPVIYVDPSGHYQHRSDYRNQIHAKKLYEAWVRDVTNELAYILNTLSGCASGQSTEAECQTLINRAIEIFNLSIPEGNVNYQTIEIIFDPSLVEDDGLTTEDFINKKITIRIGPKAFKRSFGWLASSINHELCHARQMLGPTCQTYRVGGFRASWVKSEGYRKYSFVTQGDALNEVEAYDLELSTAQSFGLTADEIAEIERGKRVYYSYLNYSNKILSHYHNYLCQVQTCNYSINYTE